jgi:SSS family solute:Na+ symporter
MNHVLLAAGVPGAVDLGVVIAAVGLLFFIAWLAGRNEHDTGDFFLGKRRVPAAVACLSFVATEVSAITLTGVPATAYSENWQYLQFFFGSASARFFVAFLFIPVFYHHNCTSIYEFLRHRFNPQTQYAGSICFFITRLISAGVRLYAACLAIAVIMHWPLPWTLLVFISISMAFITFGGVKAVVWAGAYISLIFFGAGIGLIIYLLSVVQVPAEHAVKVASEAGRLSVFKFTTDLNDPTTFWAGTANAFFICLAVFGTDQELVQRLLTVKTRKSSQKAIIATTFASLPMLCIYLCLGTLLYIYYATTPGAAVPAESKTILSNFVMNVVPAGLKGLFLAAIVMASIDMPLASLSSSFVYDIYRPLINKTASEKHYLLVSRLGVAAFGLILAAIALACTPVQNVLWFAFKIVSVTGGAMLGIFLFGVFSQRITRFAQVVSVAVLAALLPFLLLPIRPLSGHVEKTAIAFGAAVILVAAMKMISRSKSHFANIFAMSTSAVAMALVLIFGQMHYLTLAWSWLIVAGTIMTVALACVLNPCSGAKVTVSEQAVMAEV